MKSRRSMDIPASRLGKTRSSLISGVLISLIGLQSTALASTIQVDAASPLVASGILAQPGQSFTIAGSGSVNIAEFDGPYTVDPNGTILQAPAPGSTAFWFFRDNGLPVGVDPVVGIQKLIPLVFGAPFPGAPYGALVAGFSPSSAPVLYSGFPDGFRLIGTSGVITAPSTGGYLYLVVNDVNRFDNVGSFTAEVKAIYSWSGVLPPINADGSSVFKAGSTVPVKFQLTGDSAGITDLQATLSYAQVADDGSVGAVNEAGSTSAATTGNLFRYDSTSGQYIFNWGTKSLPPGLYQLQIELGDGVVHRVQVGLK